MLPLTDFYTRKSKYQYLLCKQCRNEQLPGFLAMEWPLPSSESVKEILSITDQCYARLTIGKPWEKLRSIVYGNSDEQQNFNGSAGCCLTLTWWVEKSTINTEPCEELTKDETALTPEETQFVYGGEMYTLFWQGKGSLTSQSISHF